MDTLMTLNHKSLMKFYSHHYVENGGRFGSLPWGGVEEPLILADVICEQPLISLNTGSQVFYYFLWQQHSQES